MTVENTNLQGGPYAGDGFSTIFQTNFYFLNNNEITVLRLNTDGSISTLSLNSDYTVSGAGDEDGGSITLSSGSVAPFGSQITIVPNLAFTQEQSYPATGIFPSLATEQGFDRAVLRDQKLQGQLNYAMQFPLGDIITPVMPSASVRAGKNIGFDSTGQIIMLQNAGVLKPQLTYDVQAPFSNHTYTLSNNDWGNLVALDSTDGQDFVLTVPNGVNALPAGFYAYLWSTAVINTAQRVFFAGGSVAGGWKETQSILLFPGDVGLIQSVGNGNYIMVGVFRADPRIRLFSALTVYVNASTGSDSNNGLSSSAAFATIQAAVLFVQNKLDLNGQTVTISVADGTYTAGATVNGAFVGAGTVNIVGDTTTPANCVVGVTNQSCFTAQNGGRFGVAGFKMTTTSSGTQISATGLGSQININGNVEFGATASGWNQIASDHGGNVTISTSAYKISAGCASHFFTIVNGSITVTSSPTITLSGTPAWANAFATTFTFALISAANMTFSGSATGTRYSGFTNSVIDTGSGASATYFPGNSNGSTSSGSQYS